LHFEVEQYGDSGQTGKRKRVQIAIAVLDSSNAHGREQQATPGEKKHDAGAIPPGHKGCETAQIR
jgi:hypothetical protein